MPQDLPYFQAQEKLNKYIKILLESPSFISQEEKKLSFKKIISDSLVFFKYLCSKTFSFQTELEQFLVKFREFFGHDNLNELSAKLDEKQDFDFQTEADLYDHLNYTKVSTKNIFNVNLDEVNIQDLNKNSSNVIYNPKNYPKANQALSVYKNFFNSSFPETFKKQNTEYIEELLLKSHAWDRLNKDIHNKTIYIYKTKPKKNLNIKYFLVGTLLLGLLFSMLLFFGIVANAKNNNDSATKQLPLFVLFISTFLYFGLLLRSILKSLKNDNFKYSFQKKDFYFVLIFTIFFSIWATIQTTQLADFITDSSNNIAVKFVAVPLLIFVILVIAIVYMYSYTYLNPEKNEELIADRLSKHMEKLVEEGMDTYQ